jgi:hypothetical protein
MDELGRDLLARSADGRAHLVVVGVSVVGVSAVVAPSSARSPATSEA